jgi:hypothetical protein
VTADVGKCDSPVSVDHVKPGMKIYNEETFGPITMLRATASSWWSNQGARPLSVPRSTASGTSSFARGNQHAC